MNVKSGTDDPIWWAEIDSQMQRTDVWTQGEGGVWEELEMGLDTYIICKMADS